MMVRGQCTGKMKAGFLVKLASFVKMSGQKDMLLMAPSAELCEVSHPFLNNLRGFDMIWLILNVSTAIDENGQSRRSSFVRGAPGRLSFDHF